MSDKTRPAQRARWPKVAEIWRRAGARYWATHPETQARWDTPDAFFEWWASDKPAPRKSGEAEKPETIKMEGI